MENVFYKIKNLSELESIKITSSGVDKQFLREISFFDHNNFPKLSNAEIILWSPKINIYEILDKFQKIGLYQTTIILPSKCDLTLPAKILDSDSNEQKTKFLTLGKSIFPEKYIDQLVEQDLIFGDYRMKFKIRKFEQDDGKAVVEMIIFYYVVNRSRTT